MANLTEARAQYEPINVAKTNLSPEAFDSVHIDALTPIELIILRGPTQQEVFTAQKDFEKFKLSLSNGFIGKIVSWLDFALDVPSCRAQQEVGRQILIRRKLRGLHQTPTFRNSD